jgi:thiamine-monophosphate kinase
VTLGDAALGLLVANGEFAGLSSEDAAYLLDRYHLPQPRLSLGRGLVGLAHAAMDLSDGLIGDLGHICRASGLGAEVSLEAMPLSPAFQAARRASGLDLDGYIYGGGDDYELLFTAPDHVTPQILTLAGQCGVAATAIGRMGPGGATRLLDRSGQDIRPQRRGYQHFDRPGS